MRFTPSVEPVSALVQPVTGCRCAQKGATVITVGAMLFAPWVQPVQHWCNLSRASVHARRVQRVSSIGASCLHPLVQRMKACTAASRGAQGCTNSGRSERVALMYASAGSRRCTDGARAASTVLHQTLHR